MADVSQAMPVWASRALLVALTAIMSAVGGYQLHGIAQIASLETRMAALEKRSDQMEQNLIGVKRFEDFESHTKSQLDEIKGLIQQHDHESETRIRQLESDVYGFRPRPQQPKKK